MGTHAYIYLCFNFCLTSVHINGQVPTRNIRDFPLFSLSSKSRPFIRCANAINSVCSKFGIFVWKIITLQIVHVVQIKYLSILIFVLFVLFAYVSSLLSFALCVLCFALSLIGRLAVDSALIIIIIIMHTFYFASL
jgi:hypothetical protein